MNKTYHRTEGDWIVFCVKKEGGHFQVVALCHSEKEAEEVFIQALMNKEIECLVGKALITFAVDKIIFDWMLGEDKEKISVNILCLGTEALQGVLKGAEGGK